MRTLLAIILLLSLGWHGHAQQADTGTITPSLKYGKPSEEELQMTVYRPDTAATAVVLYSKTTARYELIQNNFQLIYDYEVKIKVLKSDGASYANIEIPYYQTERNSPMKEQISKIDASAYNLEGGKVVRTKMKRDLVFKERLNSKYAQIKFSIPAVREGTVFEYQYQLTSDFYYNINSWEAQKDIPVLHTECEVVIPEYFQFNLEMRGTHQLAHKETTTNLNYQIQYKHEQPEMINCTGRQLQFTGKQLPALRSDSYVWCADDYRSGVNFELRGLNFPGSPYKSFTQTWPDIDKMLLDDEDFGSLLKMRNPYRDQMATLALNNVADIHAKIATIYTFLKQHISWDGRYGLYGDQIKKAIKEGTGSNADINFVLMSMLRDANIPCYPVVMSHKSAGLLPYTYPSIQKLNTFAVAIADTDSTFAFLDGSVTTGYLNVLPTVLLVDRARLIDGTESRWVDLRNLGTQQIRSIVKARVQPDGKIVGSREAGYTGQYASGLRKRYQTSKDSTDFVRQLEAAENIKVTKYQAKAIKDFSFRVMENLEFERQATVNNDLIYINPMVFLHVSKSPFTQAERLLPIEFSHPERIIQVTQLTLPEGYVVDEAPEQINAQTEDRMGTCRYSIKQEGNQVFINYTFTYNKLLHLIEEYKGVKAFWELVAEKNNEILVLKKI